MVEAAERHEVGRFRFASIGPMLDVVGVDVAGIRAAGKAATLVAGVENSAKWRRYGARLAPHIERLAVIVLDDGNDTRIA